jgi:nucleotide-binding universal stress UspA family protein
MIKDAVVNLPVGNPQNRVVDFAVSVASTFDAHLAGVAFVYDPFAPMMDVAAISADLIESQRLENENAANAAISKFEEAARRSAVSAESGKLEAELLGASDLFGRIARRFDLSIVAQAEPDIPGPEDTIIESALFGSGRPCLVVPYIQKAGLKLDRIMVCWDGSRNSARAAADAMPFLLRAKVVEVVIVTGERGKSEELPGADIAKHLARHGLNVEINHIVASDKDVANTILSHAADADADFIVMGGYGHSRLREFVLGGATQGILASMTIPTLMSH